MKYAHLVNHTKFEMTVKYLDDGIRWMAECMSLEFQGEKYGFRVTCMQQTDIMEYDESVRRSRAGDS